MKAVLCKAFGPPDQLEIAAIDAPTPGAGQALVAIEAAGVNFPDALIVQGKYQLRPPFPFTPGSDIAGVVTGVGEGVDATLVGTRVMGFCLLGGFAEQVACDARNLAPIPPGVASVTAAASLMTYSTSYYALKDRGQLRAGETLLVLGAGGGVGMGAVELGHIMGARVIAAAGSDEKIAACQRVGADATINYATEDLRERIKALTEGKGPDVIYDPVGGDYAEPALRSIGWGGRYLVIGFAAGDIPRIPLNLALLKGCSIVGVFWGAFTERDPKGNQANIRQLVTWLADGTINPTISATYPLADAPHALDDLLARRVTGKAVITIGGM